MTGYCVSDIAAITGGMAQALYGVPADLRAQVLPFLDRRQRAIFDRFEAVFGRPEERSH